MYSGIDLISVDSRQVYKGLELLTGADIPENFIADGSSFVSSSEDIKLHGVSIIFPDQEWSVAHFREFSLQIITSSWENGRIPILVGGTGLYHEHLFTSDSKLSIPPNQEIRKKAETMSVDELQAWVAEVNKQRLKEMNNSDQNNPRRLVRVLEQSLNIHSLSTHPSLSPDIQRTILLARNLDQIYESIHTRVRDRFVSGALEEVRTLIDQFPDFGLPIYSTLGISQIRHYISGELTAQQCLQQWAQSELAYAKRQITWWKTKQVARFLVESPNVSSQIEDYLFSSLR